MLSDFVEQLSKHRTIAEKEIVLDTMSQLVMCRCRAQNFCQLEQLLSPPRTQGNYSSATRINRESASRCMENRFNEIIELFFLIKRSESSATVHEVE